MKKTLSILVLAFLAITIFAAPFGLKMGMTLEDITRACNGVEPQYIENDCYYVFPAKTHPSFKYYAAYVNEVKGLYRLIAVSDKISTEADGKELKQVFAETKLRISKIYGEPRIIDELIPNALYHDDNKWRESIAYGERTYKAIWETNLKDNLDIVSLSVSTTKYDRPSWIILEYDFLNKKAVEDLQDQLF